MEPSVRSLPLAACLPPSAPVATFRGSFGSRAGGRVVDAGDALRASLQTRVPQSPEASESNRSTAAAVSTGSISSLGRFCEDESRCRCGRREPSPGADVGGATALALSCGAAWIQPARILVRRDTWDSR